MSRPSPLAHQGKSENVHHFSDLFRSMEKMAWDDPKWGREVLFAANPSLADILGDMDFDSDNFQFCIAYSKFLDFQVPRFPKSGPGRAWAGLETSGPKYVVLLQILVFELTRAPVLYRRDESKCHQVLVLSSSKWTMSGCPDLSRPLSNTIRTPHRKLCLGKNNKCI